MYDSRIEAKTSFMHPSAWERLNDGHPGRVLFMEIVGCMAVAAVAVAFIAHGAAQHGIRASCEQVSEYVNQKAPDYGMTIDKCSRILAKAPPIPPEMLADAPH